MSAERSWLGLRAEDLSLDQRNQIANDAETRDAHIREVELGRLLVHPPVVAERPNVNDVFSRSAYATQAFSKMGDGETNRSLIVTLPLLLVVAVLWLYTFMGEEWPWESPNTKDDSPGTMPSAGPEAVKLSATAAAIHGERKLQVGSIIEAPEKLRFNVRVTGSGYLVILDVTDGITLIYPSLDPSSWMVSEGEQDPDPGLRIDRPKGDEQKARTYRALLCDRPPWVVDGNMPEGCVTSDLALIWR